MAIRALDTKHKRLAEMLVTGTPNTMRARAEELGVTTKTLYEWIKDPLFREYLLRLGDEVYRARVQLLTGVVQTAVEAVQASLSNHLRALQGDEKAQASAPAVSTLVDCLKKLVDIERVEAGKPQSIKESRSDKPAREDTPAGRKLNALLDQLTEGEPDVASDVHGPVTH